MTVFSLSISNIETVLLPITIPFICWKDNLTDNGINLKDNTFLVTYVPRQTRSLTQVERFPTTQKYHDKAKILGDDNWKSESAFCCRTP